MFKPQTKIIQTKQNWTKLLKPNHRTRAYTENDNNNYNCKKLKNKNRIPVQ